MNVILIGLGPHAKRIYINYLGLMGIQPKVIVDLKSKKETLNNYLKENKINSEVFLIDDIEKDREILSNYVEKSLCNLILKYSITHAIISTEAKAHKSFITFFLQNKVQILTDKPLTVSSNVMFDKQKAKKIYDDYIEIYNLTQKYNSNIMMMCQRRYHLGYNYIFNLLEDIVKKYQIPISYIDIYHSDGMWNFPNEFIERENHPYKYGYGKLFHSGFHFIDLLCRIVHINDIIKEKQWNKKKICLSTYSPRDSLFSFSSSDYSHLFNGKNYSKDINQVLHHNMGELDCYTTIQYLQNNSVITTANLNLLQNSVSRRSWTDLPQDTYKSNGRIRHERVNICISYLFNIQIHSYQSYEIKDSKNTLDDEVGGLDHFDIYIFRNSDIIGGLPFEKLTLKDLKNKGTVILGHNEDARGKIINDFIKRKDCNLYYPFSEYNESIKLLSEMCIAACKEKHLSTISFPRKKI